MEIIPAVGTTQVQVGQTHAQVQEALGEPVSSHGSRAYFDPPGMLVHFDDSDTVELIELPHREGSGDEPSLDGVQLTYRIMDEVVRDLDVRGYTSTPSDIGHDFHAGFALFSMSSISASEVDSAASQDDERPVVEGVSIAPYDYFSDR